MKLRDLAKRHESIEIVDGENKFPVILTSMSIEDIEERNEHFKTAHREAMNFTRDQVIRADNEAKAMSRDEILNYLCEIQSSALTEDSDLINVENEKVLSKEEIEENQEKEQNKLKKKVRKDYEKMDNEALTTIMQIQILRSKYLMKLSEQLLLPTLCIVCRDETGQRILNMNPNSEDCIKKLDPELINQIAEKAAKFIQPIWQSDIRRVVNDPDFLLLSTLAKKGE